MRSILTTVGEIAGLGAAQVGAWMHSVSFGLLASGVAAFVVSVLVGDE